MNPETPAAAIFVALNFSINENLAKLVNYPRFIDTSKVITNMSGINYSWIATEDCYIAGNMLTSGVASIVYLDGAEMASTLSGTLVPFCFYVKKGQTISTRNTSGGTYNGIVYGLM